MNFDIEKSIEILERTPFVLHALLGGLSGEWINSNEGQATWSPYDVIGHLIHGEKTDWVPRMEVIFSDLPEKSFEPFDRFAQFRDNEGKNLQQLLDEFKTLRLQNIERLRSRQIMQTDFLREGTHPAFGPVTLSQLLATWVVHDLNHISQICRVMAKQYTAEVGPWKEYLGILKR